MPKVEVRMRVMIRRFRLVLVCAAALSALPLSAQGVKPASLPSTDTHPTAAASPAKAAPAKAAGSVVSVPESIIKTAMAYRGVPYVLGGISRDGVDCAGLIYRVFSDVTGLDLPRGVRALFNSEQSTWYRLHIGDLLFFDTDEDPQLKLPSHVGVYTGQGRFVHAASEGPSTGVILSSLAEPYYRDRYIGSRRVIKWREPVLDVILRDEPGTIVDRNPFASHELLTIRVINKMTGGGPVSLDLYDGERKVQSQWVTPGGLKPAEVSFVPDIGVWTVRLSRVFKGRELEKVTFTVVE
jgi:cell wall-associated NlpC family hydrolase